MIWKKLVVEGHRFTTSSDIQEMARKLGNNPKRSLRYLQEHGYIYRILRGIFYVKSPEERERGFFEYSVYEMVIEALKIKGVKNWYFGLETALKMNNMTHEYFTVNYVITDLYRTTKVINILDTKFHFLKRCQKYFKFGIRKQNGLRYSDKEKTVLDIIYKRVIKNKESKYILSPFYDYGDLLDKKQLTSYLHYYPKRFGELMRGLL